MRPRTLGVLFALVAGLAAFIWLFERHLPSSGERQAGDSRVLDLDRSGVTGLEIRLGDRIAVLEAKGGVWRLVEPFAARADAARVESLLDILEALEASRVLTDASAEAVGLANPRGAVTIRSRDAVAELLIGSEVPASATMIVGLAGASERFVVTTDLWSDVDREPGDWRSRELLSVSRDEIVGVTLLQDGEGLELRRAGDAFRIESPIPGRADPGRIDELLDTLVSLRVAGFVDEPPAHLGELGLEPPLRVVRVELAEAEAPVFELELGHTVEGGDDPGERLTWARFGSQILRLRTDLRDFFGIPVDAWGSPPASAD